MDVQIAPLSSTINKHLSTEGSEDFDEEFRYLTLPPTSATFTETSSSGDISTPSTTPPPPDSAHSRKAFIAGPSPRHSAAYSPMAPPPKLPLPALPPSTSTFSSPRSSASVQLSAVPKVVRQQQQNNKRAQSQSPSPPTTSSGIKVGQPVVFERPPRSPRDKHPPSSTNIAVRIPSSEGSRHRQHRKQNSIDEAHRRAAAQQQHGPALETLFAEPTQSDNLFGNYSPISQGGSRRGSGKGALSSIQPTRSSSGQKNPLMVNTTGGSKYANLQQQQRYVHSSRQQDAEDDVVMNDETSTVADTFEGQPDFNDSDFEYLNLPNAAQTAAMERKLSTRTTNFEAAWADDASCIDVSDRYQESEDHNDEPQETFEVAALRRQVEQLQMALQRQMATQRQTTAKAAQQKRSVAEMRLPFGMPTPSKSYDSGSTLHNKSSSSKTSQIEDLSSDIDQYTDYQGMRNRADTYGADRNRRLQQPHRSQQQMGHPYMDTFGSGSISARKAKRGSIVSSLFDESASTLGRKDDHKKVEELAKKIEALEKMFQSSSVSSMSPTEERPQQQYTDVRRSPIEERNSPVSPRSFAPGHMEMLQNGMMRKSSMATISDSNGGRRSPAASAFHFNPTGHSSHDYAMGRSGSSESVANNNARTKSVARFIMGVGSSRSNVPRDEYGNPLPAMQVSWSRKRTEKVAKPTTTAKMKVGPGRGRIVMKPPPS